jgi:hypothetical protein
MDQRQKNTQKIGRKHRTPSEKEKKGTPKVFQHRFFTSTLKEITALANLANFHVAAILAISTYKT